MRASEFIFENFGEYKNTNLPLGRFRGNYDPRTGQPYEGNFEDSFELLDIAEEMLEEGYEPELVNLYVKDLIATQDWLSDYGSDGPLLDDYTDYPVVIHYDGNYYIMDGHHRASRALSSNKQVIKVYLFEPDQ